MRLNFTHYWWPFSYQSFGGVLKYIFAPFKEMFWCIFWVMKIFNYITKGWGQPFCISTSFLSSHLALSCLSYPLVCQLAKYTCKKLADKVQVSQLALPIVVYAMHDHNFMRLTVIEENTSFTWGSVYNRKGRQSPHLGFSYVKDVHSQWSKVGQISLPWKLTKVKN